MIPRSDFITFNDFSFRDKFIGLTEAQFNEALQIINAQFSGVYTLWSVLTPADALSKRRLCINYLVAWKLTDMYPEAAVDVIGTGGMPISMKKAGPMMVKFNTTVRQGSALAFLETNMYGINALSMIQSAPETNMWGS